MWHSMELSFFLPLPVNMFCYSRVQWLSADCVSYSIRFFLSAAHVQDIRTTANQSFHCLQLISRTVWAQRLTCSNIGKLSVSETLSLLLVKEVNIYAAVSIQKAVEVSALVKILCCVLWFPDRKPDWGDGAFPHHKYYFWLWPLLPGQKYSSEAAELPGDLRIVLRLWAAGLQTLFLLWLFLNKIKVGCCTAFSLLEHWVQQFVLQVESNRRCCGGRACPTGDHLEGLVASADSGVVAGCS